MPETFLLPIKSYVQSIIYSESQKMLGSGFAVLNSYITKNTAEANGIANQVCHLLTKIRNEGMDIRKVTAGNFIYKPEEKTVECVQTNLPKMSSEEKNNFVSSVFGFKDPSLEKICQEVAKEKGLMPRSTVSPEEWKNAKEFFEKNPSESKMKRKNKTDHSFIQVTLNERKEIFAIANKNQEGHLGATGGATVKLAYDEAGTNFAVKIEKKESDKPDEDDENHENKILAKLGLAKGTAQKRWKDDGHQHKFKEEPLQKGHEKTYQLLPLAKGVSLQNYIPKDNAERLSIALAICKKVKALHENRIIHGDLHQGNIMIENQNGEIKVTLIDFGRSQALPQDKDQFKLTHPLEVGPVDAPEVREGTYSTASDVYSLGKIFQREGTLGKQVGEELDAVEPLLSNYLKANHDELNDLQITLRAMISHRKKERPSLDDVINKIEKIQGKNLTLNSLQKKETFFLNSLANKEGTVKSIWDRRQNEKKSGQLPKLEEKPRLLFLSNNLVHPHKDELKEDRATSTEELKEEPGKGNTGEEIEIRKEEADKKNIHLP